jgi:hypothetical protein
VVSLPCAIGWACTIFAARALHWRAPARWLGRWRLSSVLWTPLLHRLRSALLLLLLLLLLRLGLWLLLLLLR